jgi:hypothetical protein
MIFLILSILLYQSFTGAVEGIKNLQVSERWYTCQKAYHWWRVGQGASALLIGLAGAYTGFSWHAVIAVLFSWAGDDGFYNRVLNWFAWYKINHDWHPIERLWWVKLLHPSVESDWLRFGLCTAGAIITVILFHVKQM